jgi:hypothetical protein
MQLRPHLLMAMLPAKLVNGIYFFENITDKFLRLLREGSDSANVECPVNAALRMLSMLAMQHEIIFKRTKNLFQYKIHGKIFLPLLPTRPGRRDVW